jgi:hypothetical protein
LIICYQVVFVGAFNTIIVNRLPASVRPSDISTIGFALPLSTEVAAALGFVAPLFGVGVFLATARLFMWDLDSLSSLPSGLFTRRIGRAFLSVVVVSTVLAVVVPLGFALLFIPGLFPTASLQFALFAVAVKDTDPIDALRRSWGLGSGNRWRLLALVVLFGILADSFVQLRGGAAPSTSSLA